MRKLFFISIIIISGSCYVNAQNLAWARKIGGINGAALSAGITVDQQGNNLNCGTFSGNTDFDPGIGTFIFSPLQTYFSGYVQKMDLTGNLIWVKQFDGQGSTAAAAAVTTDASGNVYVTGTFHGSVDLDPGSGTYIVSYPNPNLTDICMFVCKLNSNGDFQWGRAITGPGMTKPLAIMVDPTNQSLYTTGSFSNTIDFNTGSGTYTLDPAFGTSFIHKLDTAGNFIWARNIGSNVYPGTGVAIAHDVNGNVYTTGNFFGAVNDFDPGPATYSLNYSFGSELYISKLSASGDFISAQQIGGVGDYHGTGILVNGSKVYVSGFYSDTTDFDPGPASYTLNSVSWSQDGFVMSLDTSGIFQWASGFGGYGIDYPTSLIQTNSGNLICGGYFDQSGDFDPGINTHILNCSGQDDAFILELTPTGNFVWAGAIGNNGLDRIASLGTDSYDNVYMSGRFMNTVDFYPGSSTYTLNAGPSGVVSGFAGKFSGTCASPQAPQVASPSTLLLCESQSATFSVTGNANMLWYSSATSSIPVQSGPVLHTQSLIPGSYTWFAEANTCTNSIVRAQVSATVYANPQLILTGSSPALCAGETYTISASGADTYTWISGQNQASIAVSPNLTTAYSLTASAGPSCNSTSVFTVEVIDCLGFSEVKEIKSITTYPNPSNGLFHLRFANTEQIYSVIIIDALGRPVPFIFDSSTGSIQIEHVEEGIYNLEVLTNNGTYHSKILLKD